MNLQNGLPEFAYTVNNMTDEVVMVKRFQSGYFPLTRGNLKGKEAANELNMEHGITKAQAEAMFIGSLFGWHVPGADPAMYNDEGKPDSRPSKTGNGNQGKHVTKSK